MVKSYIFMGMEILSGAGEPHFRILLTWSRLRGTFFPVIFAPVLKRIDMSKRLIFPLFLFLAMVFATSPAFAQKSKSKRSSGLTEYLDDKGNFASHLWYGGNFNLGLSGNSYYNLFNAGISPMVGYKILPSLSVGPRVSLQYTYIKGLGTDGNVHKVQPVSYSIGAFARFKFLRSLFIHAEYEYENAEFPYFSGPFLFYDLSQAKIATERIGRDNVYIGAGFNSSANAWGYELLLLYNATAGDNSLTLPFLIRFGITYNF